MSLKSQLKAATVLMAAHPPHRSDAAVRDIVRLRGGRRATEPAFINAVLGTTTKRLHAVECGNAAAGCGRDFLPSEYNRDGDAYRCPWCNHFTSCDGDVFAAVAAPTDKLLRRLERRLIAVFAEYAFLYYGAAALCNCYAWSLDGTTSNVGIAVLILKESPGDAEADDAAARRGSVWNSQHVFACRHDAAADRFEYLTSTAVFVDTAAGPCRFNGVVRRDDHTFRCAFADDLFAHVANVGARVQQVENKIRDEMAAVQFGKAAQVTGALRASAATQERLRHHQLLATRGDGMATTASMAGPALPPAMPPAMPASPVAPAPTVAPPAEEAVWDEPELEEPADVAAEADTAEVEEEEEVVVWSEQRDEEGHVYFYNDATEEAVWDEPEGAVHIVRLKKKKKKNRHHDVVDDDL
jgi:capping protein beta